MIENRNGEWFDEDGNRLADRDTVELGLLFHFPNFRPYDVAMFGGWRKEQVELRLMAALVDGE